MKTYTHIKNTCQKCHYEMECSTETFSAGTSPKENDITVCFKCGTVYFYNIDLSLRLMTENEKKHLALSSPQTFNQLLKILQAIAVTRQEKRKYHFN